jgi:hypothetical protein
MKVTLQSTSRIVQVNGLPGRVWEGTTEGGVRCFAVITRIAAHKDADLIEFERALLEQQPPSDEALQVFPLRMVL